MEVVGGRWATICGLAIEYFWVAGWLLLALFSYYITSWRTLLMATSVPGIIMIVLTWRLPESPKWLLSVGRSDEASEVKYHILVEVR